MLRTALQMLSACAVAGCSTPKPVYAPILPYRAPGVTSLSIAEGAVPEKATVMNNPIDYSSLQNPLRYNPIVVPAVNAAERLVAILIVAGFDASIDEARKGRLNAFLFDQKFDARKVFYDELGADLTKAGFLVSNGQAAGAAPAAKLDVRLAYYGYQLVPGGWAPTAHAIVTVISADGSRILMRDAIALGLPSGAVNHAATPLDTGRDTIILPYDPAYVLKNEKDIVEGDPAVSIGGLRFALVSIAREVAELLRGDAGQADVRPPAGVQAHADVRSGS
jgi:hypothetical protein